MNKKIREYFNNKSILITRGLGSIGSALVKGLLSLNPKNIKVVDNWETELSYGIYYNKDEKIEYYFINIKDKSSMDISQAVKLILSDTYYTENSEIFIFKRPFCKVSTLPKAYLESKGYPLDYYILTGIKKEEKIHEKLLAKEDSGLLMEKDEFFLKLLL